MAKKILTGGFSFEKIPQITNGLIIPTGNDIRPPQEAQAQEPVIPRTIEPKPQVIASSKQAQVPKHPKAKKSRHNFTKFDIDEKAFTPMTNVVPTIPSIVVPTNSPVIVPQNEPKFKGLSRRARQRITHADVNMEEFGALENKDQRITYLARRGWSLKTERRGNTFYHYATKYVERKKKRFYLGPIHEDMQAQNGAM